jgi:hypothetical protein
VAQSTEWNVGIRARGEGYELTSLAPDACSELARADDTESLAALFYAPRAGADRYPDWAAFEWSVRIPDGPARRSWVWRIAESSDWAAFLGQAVPPGAVRVFPLAAALWKGWRPGHSARPKALYWQSEVRGHLWITRPAELPAYQLLDFDVSPDILLLALSRLEDPSNTLLEIGGVSEEVRSALARILPGPVRPVEPFADLIVDSPLRAELSELEDPTAYLPALGAALALANGAPPVLNVCASWPEVAAGAA